jgi:hypothetical protein
LFLEHDLELLLVVDELLSVVFEFDATYPYAV